MIELAPRLPEINTAPALDASRPVVLRAAGLIKAFGGHVVLNGIDLELRRGDVVLLRGQNGEGKTSLVNILTGHLEPDHGSITYQSGSAPHCYKFPRRWWQGLNPFDHFTPEFAARAGVGRTWQDVRLFRSMTLRDNIAVANPQQPGENPLCSVFVRGMVGRAETRIRAHADALLHRLGLAGREDSSANKVSLGQSKRVAIARAGSAGASVIFLDEPLAGLDRAGIADTLALMEALVREQGVTLVVIEHVFNQPLLRHLITSDWLLADGKLTISGGAAVRLAMGESAHEPPPDDRRSVAIRESNRQKGWMSFFARTGARVEVQALPRGAVLTRVCDPPIKSDLTLELQEVVARRGARTVIGLDDEGRAVGFNLALRAGEIAILQAPNGWGKSTLFAAILGLIPSDGTILMNGKSLVGVPTWGRVRRGLGALPADARGFPDLSVSEWLFVAGSTAAKQTIETLKDRAASSLSGGERQRVAWQGLLGSKRTWEVLILDEPFGGLDGASVERLAAELRQAPCRSILILVPKAGDAPENL